MPSYIEFGCQCGRKLRAREEQAGSEVRCWDCRAQVPVPHPKTRATLAGELAGTPGTFVNVQTFGLFLAGSLLLAGLMTIRAVGPVICLVLAALAASWYRDEIARGTASGPPDADEVPERPWHTWISRWAWGLVCVVGVAMPFVLRHGVMDRAGRLVRLGGAGVAAVAVLAWLLTPLVLLAAAVGVRHAWRVVVRHPVAVALTLLLLPVGFVLVETMLVLITWQQAWLPFLLLDLFPVPGASIYTRAGSLARPFDPDDANDALQFVYYLRTLPKGFTLTGSLINSLLMRTYTRLSPYYMLWNEYLYLAVRVLFSALALTCIATVLAIQARWLRLIVAIDELRKPARPAPGVPTRAI